MNKFMATLVAGTAVTCAILLSQAALAALAGDAKDERATEAYDPARRELTTVDRYAFGAEGIVDILSRNGSVRVEGWDRPEAELTVTRKLDTPRGFFAVLTGGQPSEKRAQAILEAANPEVASGAGVLRIRAPKTEYGEPQVTIHLSLRVPRATGLRIESNNGRVQASDLAGTLEACTDNGELEIARVSGPVVAHTKNGRLRLAAIDGDVVADTNNGAIECHGATGSVRLKTANGAIETRGVRGEALECTTSNGSIEVNVQGGDACNLDLHTGGGAVDCRLPLDSPAERHDRGLRGTVRGGGKVLALRTGNGSITVGEE
jgi:hypothetical protein